MRTIPNNFRTMKAKHPDVILIFREANHYYVYAEDANKVLSLFNQDCLYSESKDFVRFKLHQLDVVLPKLVKSGCRVAICEPINN